jgi:hypothetical protein
MNRIYQASYNDRRVSMLDHLERPPTEAAETQRRYYASFSSIVQEV